jgi:hypothetical protein
MDEDMIFEITDAAGQRVFESIPQEHIDNLDEDDRAQLLVDLQDALTDVLKKAFGSDAS